MQEQPIKGNIALYDPTNAGWDQGGMDYGGPQPMMGMGGGGRGGRGGPARGGRGGGRGNFQGGNMGGNFNQGGGGNFGGNFGGRGGGQGGNFGVPGVGVIVSDCIAIVVLSLYGMVVWNHSP